MPENECPRCQGGLDFGPMRKDAFLYECQRCGSAWSMYHPEVGLCHNCYAALGDTVQDFLVAKYSLRNRTKG